MNAHFHDAAQRHWEDAGYLFAAQRLANADHLFGLAAECALKAVMLPLGMELLHSGRPKEKKHGHIDGLWDEFLTFATNRGGARYADLLASYENPFANWKVDQRYAARSAFLLPIVQDHKRGADLAKFCLDMAKVDGVVT